MFSLLLSKKGKEALEVCRDTAAVVGITLMTALVISVVVSRLWGLSLFSVFSLLAGSLYGIVSTKPMPNILGAAVGALLSRPCRRSRQKDDD